ncbi:MAG: hypothetical protein ACKV19_25715 [Verrucomicrobiales bacterium]
MATKKKPKTPAKAAKTPAALRAAAYAIATDKKKSSKQRVAAMAALPVAAGGDDRSISASIKILLDPAEPIEVRLAALQTIQASSFAFVDFAPHRKEYIAALRKVCADENLEMRQRVLGILSREKDGYAQKKLLEGLQNPEKALVPPEKALQLISYDVHAEVYPLAREIVANPPNTLAKQEAVRLLAADTNSIPFLEKLFRDKTEDTETRQIAGAAVQAAKPEEFQRQAKEVVLDASENDEVQATCLTAITHFGNRETIEADPALQRHVKKMSTSSSSATKKSATQFFRKFGK